MDIVRTGFGGQGLDGLGQALQIKSGAKKAGVRLREMSRFSV